MEGKCGNTGEGEEGWKVWVGWGTCGGGIELWDGAAVVVVCPVHTPDYEIAATSTVTIMTPCLRPTPACIPFAFAPPV